MSTLESSTSAGWCVVGTKWFTELSDMPLWMRASASVQLSPPCCRPLPAA